MGTEKHMLPTAEATVSHPTSSTLNSCLDSDQITMGNDATYVPAVGRTVEGGGGRRVWGERELRAWQSGSIRRRIVV
jgi:hypothetical protein